MEKDKPETFASFLRYWLDSLWSWQGLYVYAFLLFGAVDAVQGHYQVGFLEIFIASLFAILILQQKLMSDMQEQADKVFEAVEEVQQAIVKHNRNLATKRANARRKNAK